MFRLTNLNKEESKDYRNKDLIYQALERENARVHFDETEEEWLIEELDKKGIVIYQEEVSFPFEGVADSLFLQKEDEPQVEKSSFFHRSSKGLFDRRPTKKDKQELRMDVSDSQKSSQGKYKRVGKFFCSILLVSGLVVSMMVASYSMLMAREVRKQVKPLKEELVQMRHLQEISGELDTIGRYFLSHYYSSNKPSLSSFVKKGLEVEGQAEHLSSVLLESIRQEKSGYVVTYVVVTSEGDNRKQKRICLEMKEDKQNPYGFSIWKQPIEKPYP